MQFYYFPRNPYQILLYFERKTFLRYTGLFSFEFFVGQCVSITAAQNGWTWVASWMEPWILSLNKTKQLLKLPFIRK